MDKIKLTFLFSMLIISSIYSQFQSNKIDPSLLEKYESIDVSSVLIKLKDNADLSLSDHLNTKVEKANFVVRQLRKTAIRSQISLKNFLDNKHIEYKSFFVVNAIQAKINLSLALEISKFEEVAYILNDADIPMPYIRQPEPTNSLRGSEPTWGIKKIKADSVWLQGIRGAGVVIAGQDTGYEWDLNLLVDKYRGTIDTNTVDHNYNWHDAISEINGLNVDSTLVGIDSLLKEVKYTIDSTFMIDSVYIDSFYIDSVFIDSFYIDSIFIDSFAIDSVFIDSSYIVIVLTNIDTSMIDSIFTPIDSMDRGQINPCGLNTQFPCDDNDHGSHTMGTMVGGDTTDIIGVAPDAKWIACRNMERGTGKPSTYIECYEWFISPTDLAGNNPDVTKAPHVINNSWGCPPIEGCNGSNFNIMEQVVNNVKASGIVVVVSAGNDGPDCETINTPSSIFKESFTVGATTILDNIAAFSSRGSVVVDSSFRTKPNVTAPGVNIRSCVRNNEFETWRGTSMAGPHVAGTVALIISANPQLAGQVSIIEDIIESTAHGLTDTSSCSGFSNLSIPNNYYGYGRIDALKAVEKAKNIIIANKEIDRSTNELTLFPNPAHELLNVLINRKYSGIITLKLIDITGKTMLQNQWENQGTIANSILLKGIPSGIYICEVIIGEEVVTSKLFVD